MFLNHKRDGDELVVVGVYIDDLLATGTSVAAVKSFFASSKSLSIKDLGHVHKFLGMRVELESDGAYRIDQEEVIKEVLRSHGMSDANLTKTPIGHDCYEVVGDDAVLLETTCARGGATITRSSRSLGACCGERGTRGRTLHLQCTKRRDRRMRRVCTTGSSPSASHATSRAPRRSILR